MYVFLGIPRASRKRHGRGQEHHRSVWCRLLLDLHGWRQNRGVQQSGKGRQRRPALDLGWVRVGIMGFMFLNILCICLIFIFVQGDHFDKNNERIVYLV